MVCRSKRIHQFNESLTCFHWNVTHVNDVVVRIIVDIGIIGHFQQVVPCEWTGQRSAQILPIRRFSGPVGWNDRPLTVRGHQSSQRLQSHFFNPAGIETSLEHVPGAVDCSSVVGWTLGTDDSCGWIFKAEIIQGKQLVGQSASPLMIFSTRSRRTLNLFQLDRVSGMGFFSIHPPQANW